MLELQSVGALAQLAEHQTLNLGVRGSRPRCLTHTPRLMRGFLFCPEIAVYAVCGHFSFLSKTITVHYSTLDFPAFLCTPCVHCGHCIHRFQEVSGQVQSSKNLLFSFILFCSVKTVIVQRSSGIHMPRNTSDSIQIHIPIKQCADLCLPRFMGRAMNDTKDADILHTFLNRYYLFSIPTQPATERKCFYFENFLITIWHLYRL